MNILYLCHRIPYPPDKGDKIRSFHQIESLSRHHRLHVGCLVDTKEDWAHIPALRRFCASVDAAPLGKRISELKSVMALLGNRPLSVAAFDSGELRRKIRSRLASDPCDLAIVFSAAMAQYLPLRADLPTIVDYVDVDSEKWRVYSALKPWPLSWIYLLESRRLRRYEEALANRHDESLFVAEKEAQLFRGIARGARARVIPNGVDLEYFRCPEGVAAVALPTIVFVGVMDYFPNVDAVTYFADRILPSVLAAVPQAIFQIVGRNPSREVRRLGGRPNIEVTGSVSDVRPFLARAAVSVAPFRIARGVQNKILEAMAMGVPVVGSPTGFQGIGARREDGVRIEERPDDFAQTVVTYLRDSALRHECGLSARRYVERNHRWQDHGAALDALIEEVLERRSSRVSSAGDRA